MRVIVVEDSTLLREGLVRLLVDEGHDVVASLPTADGLVETADETAPDVVVMDVRMPPTHTDEGLRAALDLRERRPGTAVLVVSQYVETRSARRLLSGDIAGVGYLLKDRIAAVDEFLDALSRVAGGGSSFDPEVVRRLVSGRDDSDVLRSLTPGEERVLTLMAAGHSNGAIARRLHVSRSAVEKHIAAIFTKFDLPVSNEYSRRVLAILRHFGE